MKELDQLQSYCNSLWKNQELIKAQVRYCDQKIKVKVEKKYEKAFYALVKQVASLLQFHIGKTISTIKYLKEDEAFFKKCLTQALQEDLEECFSKLFADKDFEGFLISVTDLKSTILHLYYREKIYIQDARYYNPVTNAYWNAEAHVWEHNNGKEFAFFLHPSKKQKVS